MTEATEEGIPLCQYSGEPTELNNPTKHHLRRLILTMYTAGLVVS